MNNLFWTMTILFADTQLGGGPGWGKVAFIGTFVLLLIWLVVMPARLIQQEQQKPGTPGTPIWKNARAWAILITLIQIGVYSVLG